METTHLERHLEKYPLRPERARPAQTQKQTERRKRLVVEGKIDAPGFIQPLWGSTFTGVRKRRAARCVSF